MLESVRRRRAGCALAVMALFATGPALASHEEAKHIEALMPGGEDEAHEEGEGREESWQIEQRQLWFERTRTLRSNPDAGRHRAAAAEALKQERQL